MRVDLFASLFALRLSPQSLTEQIIFHFLQSTGLPARISVCLNAPWRRLQLRVSLREFPTPVFSPPCPGCGITHSLSCSYRQRCDPAKENACTIQQHRVHQGIHDHLTSLSVPSHAGVVNAAGAALDVLCDGRPDSYVQEHKQQCSNAYSGGFFWCTLCR